METTSREIKDTETSRAFAAYKEDVREHAEELKTALEQITVVIDHAAELTPVDEGHVFAGLHAAYRSVRESLRNMVLQRDEQIQALIGKIKVIREQETVINELLIPVLEAWEGVLVVPLIGNIDDKRGALIVKKLLAAIAKNHASLAIVDITGIPSADSELTNRLIEATISSRLLGTQVIITGVTPTQAQALAALGLDTNKIVTKASLKTGLCYALSQLSSGHGDRQEQP